MWREGAEPNWKGTRSILPLWKVFPAWSTERATTADSGETDSVPVSMRPWSSRAGTRPRVRSACSLMIRKNCSVAAGYGARYAPSTALAEPLMDLSGERSSSLTMPSFRDSYQVQRRISGHHSPICWQRGPPRLLGTAHRTVMKQLCWGVNVTRTAATVTKGISVASGDWSIHVAATSGR